MRVRLPLPARRFRSLRWTCRLSALAWGVLSSRSRRGGIQIDAYGQQVRTQRRGGAHAESPPEITLSEHVGALARVVVVEDVRRSGSPSSEWAVTHQHTNARILLDVLHVIGAVSELGHQPEGMSYESIADTRALRTAGGPADRFKEGVTRRPGTKFECELDKGTATASWNGRTMRSLAPAIGSPRSGLLRPYTGAPFRQAVYLVNPAVAPRSAYSRL
jgi:hypothetical protein